jgi:hypothetical protein
MGLPPSSRITISGITAWIPYNFGAENTLGAILGKEGHSPSSN